MERCIWTRKVDASTLQGVLNSGYRNDTEVVNGWWKDGD